MNGESRLAARKESTAASCPFEWLAASICLARTTIVCETGWSQMGEGGANHSGGAPNYMFVASLSWVIISRPLHVSCYQDICVRNGKGSFMLQAFGRYDKVDLMRKARTHNSFRSSMLSITKKIIYVDPSTLSKPMDSLPHYAQIT